MSFCAVRRASGVADLGGLTHSATPGRRLKSNRDFPANPNGFPALAPVIGATGLIGHFVVITNINYSPKIRREKPRNPPPTIITIHNHMNCLNVIFGDNLSR
jgi:hypothetical protein